MGCCSSKASGEVGASCLCGKVKWAGSWPPSALPVSPGLGLVLFSRLLGRGLKGRVSRKLEDSRSLWFQGGTEPGARQPGQVPLGPGDWAVGSRQGRVVSSRNLPSDDLFPGKRLALGILQPDGSILYCHNACQGAKRQERLWCGFGFPESAAGNKLDLL